MLGHGPVGGAPIGAPFEWQPVAETRFQRLLAGLVPSKLAAISTGMILMPERKVTKGFLIRSTS